MEITEFMKFSPTSIYFLEAIARVKHNKELTKKDRNYCRAPVRSIEEYEIELDKMRYSCLMSGKKMYIYLTVNSRNTIKAYKIFREKLVAYEMNAFSGGKDFIPRIANIDEVWYKACLQTDARETKYFMVDIDTKEKAVLGELRNASPFLAYPIMEIETMNGYHWITDRFDVTKIASFADVSVHKDGRMFLEAIGFD